MNQWCQTKVCVSSNEWSILQKKCISGIAEMLLFSTHLLTDTQWKLQFYPNGTETDKQYLSFDVQCTGLNTRGTLVTSIMIECPTLNTTHTHKNTFITDTHTHIPHFLSLEHIRTYFHNKPQSQLNFTCAIEFSYGVLDMFARHRRKTVF